MKDAEPIEKARRALVIYDSPSSDGGKRLPLVARNLIDDFIAFIDNFEEFQGIMADATPPHLGVTERTIRQMIADGRLAGYRCGAKLIRVDLNEIDDEMRPYGGAE